MTSYERNYFDMMHRKDGMKWIRSYHVKDGWRFALWTFKDGKKVRVGTAYSEEEYMRWWGWSEEKIAESIAICGRL